MAPYLPKITINNDSVNFIFTYNIKLTPPNMNKIGVHSKETASADFKKQLIDE